MNKYFKLIILTFISIACLYVAFQGEDLNELKFHLGQTDLVGVCIAILLLVFSCIIRALRWQFLLNPLDTIQFKKVFGATMVGYFGNGILAFRLGELLKAYYVSKGRNLKVMQAFGTVIIERIMDIAAVIIIFILLIPWFPFEDNYIRYGALGFTGLSIFLIIVLYFNVKYRLDRNLKKIKWFSSNLGMRVFSAMDGLFEGMEILRENDNVRKIITTSIFLWGIYYIETLILLRACGLSLELLEIGILLVLGSIVFGIPALPGSAGTYDAGIKYSLVIVFNITGERALNYAIVSHFVAYFPLLIIGLIYFLIGNIRLDEIKRVEVES